MNWLCTGKFRRLRAASDFARGGKVTKTPPGTAPDEHFVLIVAFPRTPLRGTRTCQVLQYFRRAKSEWLSAIPSGPLGPGFAKIRTGAVKGVRLALPNQRSRYDFCRRGGPMWPPATTGIRPYRNPNMPPSSPSPAAALEPHRPQRRAPNR